MQSVQISSNQFKLVQVKPPFNLVMFSQMLVVVGYQINDLTDIDMKYLCKQNYSLLSLSPTLICQAIAQVKLNLEQWFALFLMSTLTTRLDSNYVYVSQI